jgi:uncharacterized protein (TIGR02001 family)
MAKLKALIMGLLGALFVLSPALAADEQKSLIPGSFSANVGLFSDYTFRGASQTRNLPAVQGGIDWSLDTGMHGIGVYLGAWGSNVNFNDGDNAQVEIDAYGGLTKKFGPVDAKAGFIRYNYPGAASTFNYDFTEGTLGLSSEIAPGVTVGLNYNGTTQFQLKAGTAHYVMGSVGYKVPIKMLDLTLNGTIGHQSIEKNDVWGTPDYWDWKIGATAALTSNISITAFYTDTDLSKAECFSGTNLCDARGQIGITAAF